MEFLSYLIISNGTVVITALLASTILCIFSLLLMNVHSPQSAMIPGAGQVDHVEGALKRILSEHDWGNGAPSLVSEDEKVNLLVEQIEVLEAELAETKEGSTESVVLQKEVTELTEKLDEYKILEDDIADLSKFKQENEELKKKLSEQPRDSAVESSGESLEDEILALRKQVAELEESLQQKNEVMASAGELTDKEALKKKVADLEETLKQYQSFVSENKELKQRMAEMAGVSLDAAEMPWDEFAKVLDDYKENKS